MILNCQKQLSALKAKIHKTFHCEEHSLPLSNLLDNVSPGVAQHFISSGYAELIPGAMLIGIQTLQDLGRIWCDETPLQSLMHNVQGVFLTPFHCTLMHIALRKPRSGV